MPHQNSFNTQPPEGGWGSGILVSFCWTVSTHSRLKAAGMIILQTGVPGSGFNTQPPEGGWVISPRKRLWPKAVSTHSRLKAAGKCLKKCVCGLSVSTHSRLKAAGYS